MAGLVINSTAVLRLNFCAKLNICALISATSPSCKTLGNIQKAHRTNSTFGFCRHAKPTLKKPKELFFANALTEIERINDNRKIHRQHKSEIQTRECNGAYF